MSGHEDDDEEGTAVLTMASLGISPARSVPTPFLILLAGDEAGRMVRVDPEVTVGRSPKALLRFSGDGVSRLHARFYREADVTFVEDLGSTNGTFVNGERIERPVALSDGDKIQIGASFLLKFSMQDALEESFQQQLYEAALRDPLTKVYNRRAFDDRLGTEVAHVARHASDLAVMLLDLDHFKQINDTFGHLAGDHVLRTFAALVAAMTRREDYFARYGGEEFVMLCRSTNLEQARVLGDRIRGAVAREPVSFEGERIAVTVSVGVAVAWPACSPEEILQRADEALYAAKRGGRNRVVALAPP